MEPPELLVEHRASGVSTVSFNRPAQRNALTLPMLQGLQATFGELGAAGRDGPRVVVLRGVGGAFSSGSDFGQLRRAIDSGVVPSSPDDPFEHALAAVAGCPLPVIALIQGPAVGGGCALASVCDIRIAGQSARLGMPPARLGLLYSQHELRPFLDLLGPGRTKLLFFSGRLYPAEAARRFGLIDEVLPDDELEAHVYGLAQEIAANAPLTIRHTKRIVQHLTARPLGAAEAEEVAELVRLTQRSRDFAEGLRAVAEKRPPRFRGE